MLGASIAEVALNKTSQLAQVLHFIGDPIVALLIATIYSFFSLGYAKGFSKDKVLQFTNDCLGPIANILLVIGAGGAFNKVLLDSGIGTTIANMAKESHISPILLGVGNCGTNPNCNWIGNCFYDDSSWYCCADCSKHTRCKC